MSSIPRGRRPGHAEGIAKLMQLLLFCNTLGMVLVTAVCSAIFSALYTPVYKITSKGYLSIVSSS